MRFTLIFAHCMQSRELLLSPATTACVRVIEVMTQSVGNSSILKRKECLRMTKNNLKMNVRNFRSLCRCTEDDSAGEKSFEPVCIMVFR